MSRNMDFTGTQMEQRRGGALLFRVGTESFAVPLAEIEEAVEVEAVHELPGASGALEGVIVVREALVPAYAPGVALGISPRDPVTALVLRRGAQRMAVLVDDVDDVIAVDGEALTPAPGGTAATGVVRGVVHHGRRLVAVVDVDAMVAALRGVDQPEEA